MKIKRPLFIIALSVLVVINMINTLPESVFYCSLALFVLFMAVHRFTADRYTHHLVLFLLTAIVAVGWLSVFKYNLNIQTERLSSEETLVVTGTVTDKDNLGYSNCYRITLENSDRITIRNFGVAVYTDEQFENGDKIILTGKYKGFTPKSDYMYRYSQGIFGYFYADKIQLVEEKDGMTSFFSHIRRELTDKSRKMFASDTAAVAVAMGLGDKSLMDATTVNAFNFTGVAHALVVSGLHVGFVVAALTLAMYYLPFYKRIKNIVLCVFIFMFMGIIGFTPSIIRAGCLILVTTIGRTFIKETDSYTVLAIIILLTVLSNPYSATNGSLLLSYTAYFGVVKAAEIGERKSYSKIKTSLLVTVFAVLYTTPVLSMLGMQTTLLSPLMNLLLTYVIMTICILSFFLPVVSFVPVIGNIICISLAPVNNVLIRFLLQFTEFSKQYLYFAMVDLSTQVMKLAIVSGLIAVAIAYIQLTDKRQRIVLILAVPIISVLCYNFINRDVVTVKVFDGSSEPSYVIETRTDTTLIATENINYSTFKDIVDNLKTDRFDHIIVCSLKDADTEMYSEYADDVTVISDTDSYKNDVFTIYAQVSKRQMTCVIDISGVRFGFNHNKADMSGKDLDFYFFGSSVPKSIEADNCYYFYPVIKKNVDLVTDTQAKELYNIIEIKIKNGKYSVIKDVKNFGGRI